MRFSFANVLLIVSLSNSNCLFSFAHFTFTAPGSINAGSTVAFTWPTTDNPSDLTFALLLNQGNSSGVNYVVQVVEQSGIPNTGSYTWNVPNTIASGGSYYLRLQTGLASDWGGGLGTTPATTGEVYGLSNYFVMVSTVPSSSILSQTTSITPITLLATSPTSPSASYAPSSTSPTTPSFSPTQTSSPKPRKIAGIVTGSVIGVVALFAGLACLATYFANKQPPLPGVNSGRNHEFIFKSRIPEKPPPNPTQLTLTLTPLDLSKHHTYEKVVWEVINLDNDKLSVTLPHDLGFGTVAPEDGRDTKVATVTSSSCSFAPPGWTLSVRNGEKGLSFENPGTEISKSKDKVFVKNESRLPRDLAIGSYHYYADDIQPELRPFLIVEGVKSDKEFSAKRSLILQVYHTHNIQVGQLLTDEILKQSDPLLVPDGIEVAKLPQTSTWEVVETELGKVELKPKH